MGQAEHRSSPQPEAVPPFSRVNDAFVDDVRRDVRSRRFAEPLEYSGPRLRDPVIYNLIVSVVVEGAA